MGEQSRLGVGYIHVHYICVAKFINCMYICRYTHVCMGMSIIAIEGPVAWLLLYSQLIPAMSRAVAYVLCPVVTGARSTATGLYPIHPMPSHRRATKSKTGPISRARRFVKHLSPLLAEKGGGGCDAWELE